jgi:hypothetical protein
MKRFTQRPSRRTEDQGYALRGRLLPQPIEERGPQRRFKCAVEEGGAQLRMNVNFLKPRDTPRWGFRKRCTRRTKCLLLLISVANLRRYRRVQ